MWASGSAPAGKEGGDEGRVAGSGCREEEGGDVGRVVGRGSAREEESGGVDRMGRKSFIFFKKKLRTPDALKY